MGILIDKYVDLINRYAIYGEDGYYIDPFLISYMVVSELHLSMSYTTLKEFIRECEITITEEEIKSFLKKKMDEEHLELREESQQVQMPQDGNLCTTIQNESVQETKNFGRSILRTRYQFEPSSLIYFKTYISKLKKKCTTLFDILEDLDTCKSGELSKEGWKRFSNLDFHINNKGDIYVTDAIRLGNTIVYNINDLYQKVKLGNDCETYLTFKKSSNSVFESELYPMEEVQIKDIKLNRHPQFIELSEEQEKELMQIRLDQLSQTIEENLLEDGVTKTKIKD